MDFDSVTFFLDDVRRWKCWFTDVFGFATGCQPHGSRISGNLGRSPSPSASPSPTETVYSQNICVHLAAPSSTSTTADADTAKHYLSRHPAGIGDLAFRVGDVDTAYKQALGAGAMPLQPPVSCDTALGMLKRATVSGWGDLRHTLVEYHAALDIPTPSAVEPPAPAQGMVAPPSFLAIDHAVLNVPVGDMERAVAWYADAFGFECKQTFSIQTPRSALRSMVLTHPHGTATLPINEPASPHSQIQEFLEVNRGAGVQHIALATDDIVQAMARLRQNGLNFLSVPTSYYEHIPARPGFQASTIQSCLDWGAIARQGVLVDWQEDAPEALLLQAFTQPIFEDPTFFFEIIQRQQYRTGTHYHQAEGFGEGNFQALFEAMEREQLKRGSLPV